MTATARAGVPHFMAAATTTTASSSTNAAVITRVRVLGSTP
ncbi:hypothetical protein SCATT_23940 [Streptantibioticus cattleyicolor NRRL 8057 = DSM 46488]|uniref:Uncharacterized protein n=1 Tax=Streptantibioticus cattleyicolor (strain ATCC 35852 / DSM 46488 / JCM 4925 / NBRC 14057 / NRRL 8057) TaxID=1003195 RepID=G8WS05_STREN|nr:hypothetical protein SCATT_23940 [Streptantibioticus cattleyicolor NRRL 8057 = DSM 46488]